MEQTEKRLLLFGIVGFILYRYENPGLSYTGSNPMALPITPANAGTGLTVNQVSQIPTQATSIVQAQANQAITQQIQTQNLAINIAGSVASTVIGSLAAAHILAASLAGPIGAAVAAAILIVKSLISDTHLYANQLVQKYENPFGQAFIAVIQELENAYNAGTLTQNEVEAAYQGLGASWQNYEQIMHQLQNTGTDWYIVATQSLNNLDNEYLGVTLPNGKVLGAGEGGAYGDQPNYGFVSTWMDWVKGLFTDSHVLAS